jgi:Flp pilus assembly protein TadD
MSLRRSTELLEEWATRGWLPLWLCICALAGCATAPPQAANTAGVAEPGEAGEPVPPVVRTVYEQAVAVMAAGDAVEAQLRFQEFILQYPEYPGAHVNVAILQVKNADDVAAEASITKALALDPNHPEALNQLGMLRRRQGRFEEAETAYLKAVTANPDYALAHYNLGVLNELYLRRLDSALQNFERYQELGGDDERVAMWIADLKRRVGATQRTADVRE